MACVRASVGGRYWDYGLGGVCNLSEYNNGTDRNGMQKYVIAVESGK